MVEHATAAEPPSPGTAIPEPASREPADTKKARWLD
jgi:hypothetical protein